MEGFLEKVKDILHNISDYLIMGIIIFIIGFIVIWRLGIIFPENVAATDSNKVKVETPTSETIEDSKDKDPEEGKKDENFSEEEKIEIVKVSIPKGTPSADIGSILLEDKLIESIDEFDEKVYELKLEKALRSGEYDIERDSSLETIVRIIANKE